MTDEYSERDGGKAFRIICNCANPMNCPGEKWGKFNPQSVPVSSPLYVAPVAAAADDAGLRHEWWWWWWWCRTAGIVVAGAPCPLLPWSSPPSTCSSCLISLKVITPYFIYLATLASDLSLDKHVANVCATCFYVTDVHSIDAESAAARWSTLLWRQAWTITTPFSPGTSKSTTARAVSNTRTCDRGLATPLHDVIIIIIIIITETSKAPLTGAPYGGSAAPYSARLYKN